jgi:hypothetical protein
MIRQFDVGFFQPSRGEAKMTTNNSITVHSLVGNISQNSPNSSQSTTIDVGDLRNALTSFSEALKASALLSEKLDEILSDVATIMHSCRNSRPPGALSKRLAKVFAM